MARLEKIVVHDEGVSLVLPADQKTVWSIRWAAVKEVVAWKEDLFTVDLICLGFRVDDETDYYRCDEEQAGWKELNSALERVFGIKWEDWWRRVAFPALATNWTVVWPALPEK